MIPDPNPHMPLPTFAATLIVQQPAKYGEYQPGEQSNVDCTRGANYTVELIGDRCRLGLSAAVCADAECVTDERCEAIHGEGIARH
jgi:hypothetical protein